MRTVLVAMVFGLGAFGCGDDGGAGGDTPAFCTADGLLGPDGQTYGRDLDQGCRWVDDEGKPLTTYPDGNRICYVEGTGQDFPCE